MDGWAVELCPKVLGVLGMLDVGTGRGEGGRDGCIRSLYVSLSLQTKMRGTVFWVKLRVCLGPFSSLISFESSGLGLTRHLLALGGP